MPANPILYDSQFAIHSSARCSLTHTSLRGTTWRSNLPYCTKRLPPHTIYDPTGQAPRWIGARNDNTDWETRFVLVNRRSYSCCLISWYPDFLIPWYSDRPSCITLSPCYYCLLSTPYCLLVISIPHHVSCIVTPALRYSSTLRLCDVVTLLLCYSGTPWRRHSATLLLCHSVTLIPSAFAFCPLTFALSWVYFCHENTSYWWLRVHWLPYCRCVCRKRAWCCSHR